MPAAEGTACGHDMVSPRRGARGVCRPRISPPLLHWCLEPHPPHRPVQTYTHAGRLCLCRRGEGDAPPPSSDGADEPSADARQRRRLHLFNDRKRQAPDTTSPREEPAPSRAVRAPGADPRTLERTARFGLWLLPQTRSWAGKGGIRKAANRESNLVVKGNISHLRPREQYFNPFDLT